MTPVEQFAAWLENAMQQAGYDVAGQRGGGRAALAERLDVSKSTVSRWLDARSFPSATQLAPLARALNMSLPALMRDSGLARPEDVEDEPGSEQSPAHMETVFLSQYAFMYGIPHAEIPRFIRMVRLMARELGTGRSVAEPSKDS